MRDVKKFDFSATICAICLMLFQFAMPSAASAQTSPGSGPKVATAVVGGFVKALTPPVFIRKGSGPEVPAKTGDLVGANTTIRTGAGGEVILLFADGQNLALGKDSTLRIDAYRFDPANAGAGRAHFTLVSGMMRVVTGAIHTGNAAGLRISAGAAAVEILSRDVTAFVIQVEPGERHRASAAVTVGEISILTPSGQIPRIAADQYARWQDGEAPAPPQPLAAAPAVFQAIVAASRATVRESATPIDVQSAAVQAAMSMGQASASGARSNLTTVPLTGELNRVSGTVIMRNSSGEEALARIGDVFGPGTTIITRNNGQAGLLFSEGQYAALGEDSVFRISANQPAAAGDRKETSGAALGLLTGRMSFVSWAPPAENPAASNIAAGSAVISVIGKGVTAFVVEVDSASQAMGSAAVSAGEISLRSAVGPPIRLAADQFSTWQISTAATPPRPLSEAPGPMQVAFIVTLTRAPQDAEVAAAVAGLPATAAGPAPAPATTQAQAQAQAPAPSQQAQAEPVALVAVILPPVSPGGGGGCTGSPC